MTEQEQRIAIAEACGTRQPYCNCAFYQHDAGHIKRKECPNVEWSMPDYLHDLNAMHEAEKTLSGSDQRYEFLARLDEVIKHPLGEGMTFAAVTATATQRAEAFLRTLNLWKE